MPKVSEERRKELRGQSEAMPPGSMVIVVDGLKHSELLALLDEVERARRVRAALQDSFECPESGTCNSYGHDEDCPTQDGVRLLEQQQAVVESLREKVKALELQLKAAEAETSDFVGVYGEAMRKAKVLEGERDKLKADMVTAVANVHADDLRYLRQAEKREARLWETLEKIEAATAGPLYDLIKRGAPMLAGAMTAIRDAAREALQPPQGKAKDHSCCRANEYETGEPCLDHPKPTLLGERAQTTCQQTISVWLCGEDLPCPVHGPKKEGE